jgi:hypothetical protein
MSDNEEESVRQEALAEEQFLELPAALRKIRGEGQGKRKARAQTCIRKAKVHWS